jgi:hypothetical protein
VDTFLPLLQHVESLKLCELTPLTTLFVWTENSLYRLVVADGCDVLLRGGSMFPEPTPARVDGARGRGTRLKLGWIGVGFVMEFHVGQTQFATSPVVAIATERTDTNMIN